MTLFSKYFVPSALLSFALPGWTPSFSHAVSFHLFYFATWCHYAKIYWTTCYYFRFWRCYCTNAGLYYRIGMLGFVMEGYLDFNFADYLHLSVDNSPALFPLIILFIHFLYFLLIGLLFVKVRLLFCNVCIYGIHHQVKILIRQSTKHPDEWRITKLYFLLFMRRNWCLIWRMNDEFEKSKDVEGKKGQRIKEGTATLLLRRNDLCYLIA